MPAFGYLLSLFQKALFAAWHLHEWCRTTALLQRSCHSHKVATGNITPYTQTMRHAKLISAAVALVLLYGQFVVQLHMVGHLGTAEVHAHDHNHELNRSPLLTNRFSAALYERLIGLAPHAQHESLNQLLGTDTSTHTDNDCSIYHAFSGLNGLLCDGLAHTVSFNADNANLDFPALALHYGIAQAFNIRAPPAVS